MILMDLRMPEMDGVEAAISIRSMVNDPIPIITITADAVQTEKERCLASGMDAFYTKPLKKEHINSILKTYLFERSIKK